MAREKKGTLRFQQDDLRTRLNKKASRSVVVDQPDHTYVGKKTDRSFRSVVEAAATRILGGDIDFAGFGQVYESYIYRASVGGVKGYESIYGSYDLTKAAEDPESKRKIDEAYGNVKATVGVDNGFVGDAIVKTFRSDQYTRSRRSVVEQSIMLEASQVGLDFSRLDEVGGITAADDTDQTDTVQ